VNHIIAIEVKLVSGELRHFLTWGRVHDPVDPIPVAAALMGNIGRFELDGEPVAARVLWSLQPATDAPYFYEAYFAMSQKVIPFGPQYTTWERKMREAIDRGEEIYPVGHYAKLQPDEWDVTVY
jgi:hypothetical protein